jgi:hypothetical protein
LSSFCVEGSGCIGDSLDRSSTRHLRNNDVIVGEKTISGETHVLSTGPAANVREIIPTTLFGDLINSTGIQLTVSLRQEIGIKVGLTIRVHCTHVSALITTTAGLNSKSREFLSTRLERSLATNTALVRSVAHLVDTDTILWEARTGYGDNTAAVVRVELSTCVTNRNVAQDRGDETALVGTVVAVAPLKGLAVLVGETEGCAVFLLVVAACETTVCSGTVVGLHAASATSDGGFAYVGADVADGTIGLDCGGLARGRVAA